MVKITLFLSLVWIQLSASIYEQNCVTCHEKEEISLAMVYKKYLMTFSSKQAFKSNLKSYLMNPTPQKSVMPFGFSERFGTKAKSTLTPKQLDLAIESYYEKYAPKNRLH